MCGSWVTVSKTSPHAPESFQSDRTNVSQLEPSDVLQPDLKLYWVLPVWKKTEKWDGNMKCLIFFLFVSWKFLLAFIQCWQNSSISQRKRTDLPSTLSVVSAKKAQNCWQNASVDCLEVLCMQRHRASLVRDWEMAILVLSHLWDSWDLLAKTCHFKGPSTVFK